MNIFKEYLNAERGRRSALALELNISQSAISQWERVPAEQIGRVSKFTGIPHKELRPDLFEGDD